MLSLCLFGSENVNKCCQVLMIELTNWVIFFFVSYSTRMKQGNAVIFSVELPETWAGGTIYSWLYFTSPDGTMNSASQFIGQVQLQLQLLPLKQDVSVN